MNQSSHASQPILKVLLVLPYEPAAFMQADVETLGRHFDLSVIKHTRGKKQLFLSVLRRLLFERPDVLLMWFIVPSYALALTLMAKMLGVKVGFFTGGYDIVSMPRIGFGAMRFPLFRLMLKPTVRLADLVMPFSKASDRSLHKYARPRRSVVLYPGINTDFFVPSDGVLKEALAVTVSPIIESSITQKGLDTFVEAAKYAPDVRFVLVGTSPDGSIERLQSIATPNVEFVDRFLPAQELRDLYCRASSYVQVSAHEGFGIAVGEAMLCGAVPVTTKVYSLPEVTGSLGEYVPLSDPQATAAAVQHSLLAQQSARKALQAYIARNFSAYRREQELTSLLLELVPGSRRLDVGADRHAPVKLDLGCGSLQRPGFYGIDARQTRATALVADAQALPVASGVVDEVYATCLLEHFDSPSRVLDEVHRVLKPTGRGVFRVPNLGTYSSHLDTTHRFLADMSLWRSLFTGYFANVEVKPVGTKYRDSSTLVALNWLLVNVLKWYELSQGWDFMCTNPRAEPVTTYIGWWEEGEHEGRIGGEFVLPK